MLVVGVTGGIGAGKSTLAALLAERGAQIVDADALGHDALRPGRPAWHSVLDQFGDEVLVAGSMEIDRRVLAGIVFGDKDKLAALNAIVHPVIFAGIADAVETLRGTDDIVLLDAALMVETGFDDVVDVLVVVVAGEDVRTRRLRSERGMTPEDIQQRMGAQMSLDDLTARADLVVSNGGTMEDLVQEADRLWGELQQRAKR